MFTPDQIQRKKKSEEILSSREIPINLSLPCVDSENDVQIRTAKSVAERVVALAHTNLVAFDTVPPEWSLKQLAEHQLTGLLTPKEKTFLANPTPEQKLAETWKVEAIWTLLWSLKIVDELEFPDNLVNLNDLNSGTYPVAMGISPLEFISRFDSMRPKNEILDACDLYYRYDWACVDSRLHNQPMETINPEIVYERHFALNWLINYENQEWDDVRTDT